MTEPSPWVLLGLACTTAVYWLLPRAAQPWFISALSVAALGWFDRASLAALLAIALTLFITGRRREHDGEIPHHALWLITLGLVVYKLVQLVSATHPSPLSLLGFAYYTLRAIHYAVERAHGRLPSHSVAELVHYLFFLPTLPIGPIQRFAEFVRELRRRRWDAQRFSRGLERMLYGAAKIVLLATYLATAKGNAAIAAIDPSRAALIELLRCAQYGGNLYFQFAGYSDLAIGFALLLGIRVPENFSFPFLRRNISDFWQSWHITLSSFCRDYVYMPTVAWTRSAQAGALASMVAIGVWHELSLRYLVWGLYHGLGIAAWQLLRLLAQRLSLPRLSGSVPRLVSYSLATACTVLFVMLSFAITKEEDLTGTLRVLRSLATLQL